MDIAESPPATDPSYREWHRWFDDQDGTGSGSCEKTDIPLLRANVDRHEGVTRAANSHFGTANSLFQSLRPQDRLEALVSTDGSQDLTNKAIAEWGAFIASAEYQEGQAEFERIDGPTVHDIGCTLDFLPKPQDP